jgi:hypothetical protein
MCDCSDDTHKLCGEHTGRGHDQDRTILGFSLNRCGEVHNAFDPSNPVWNATPQCVASVPTYDGEANQICSYSY